MPDVITAAAMFVLGQEGWIARTRAGHVPNARGECAGCLSQLRPRWPCEQIAIADRADQLAASKPILMAVRKRPAPDR